MKKVTMTFIVGDDVADNVKRVMSQGDMGNAATYLNGNCDESDYDIEDVKS